jgi:hypothetical protein
VTVRLLLALLLTFGPVASGQARIDRCDCSSGNAAAAAAAPAAGGSCCASAGAAPAAPSDDGRCGGCPSRASAADSSSDRPCGGGTGCDCGCVEPVGPDDAPRPPLSIPSAGSELAAPLTRPIRVLPVPAPGARTLIRPAGGFSDPGPPRSGRRRLLLESILRL